MGKIKQLSVALLIACLGVSFSQAADMPEPFASAKGPFYSGPVGAMGNGQIYVHDLPYRIDTNTRFYTRSGLLTTIRRIRPGSQVYLLLKPGSNTRLVDRVLILD